MLKFLHSVPATTDRFPNVGSCRKIVINVHLAQRVFARLTAFLSDRSCPVVSTIIKSNERVSRQSFAHYNYLFPTENHREFLGSIVVSIPACHAGDRGSIPRRGVRNFFRVFFFIFSSMRAFHKAFSTCVQLAFRLATHL